MSQTVPPGPGAPDATTAAPIFNSLPVFPQTAWPWVLCLVGLDYFSTLGYQPSIAVEAAGPLAPIATILVIIATLGGVLPIYAYLAGRSPHGDGSLAVLERVIPGWRGKILIVVLLGFAATDFVFTKTLSAADAAVHITRCPVPAWQDTVERAAKWDDAIRDSLPFELWRRIVDYWDRQMVVTVLLLILGFVFWHVLRHGFDRRVVQISVVIVGLYLTLTGLVIGGGLAYVVAHPAVWQAWLDRLTDSHDLIDGMSWIGPGWLGILLLSLWVFPKMALGLSGAETTLVIMPLVKGSPGDTPARPLSRIRHMRWLLLCAAIIMSLYLAGSVLVTTLLVPPEALVQGGPAQNRALAYLAHGEPAMTAAGEQVQFWFGPALGLLYDLSTVLILGLAGASVMLVLRLLVPQFLLRFGMELEWAHRLGLIVHGLNVANLLVTLVFHASVSSQRGAYATSVLVLITGAALAALLQTRKEAPHSLARRWAFLVLTLGFLGVALAVALSRPSGLIIAGAFLAVLLPASVMSRLLRTTELRFQGFAFVDPQSRFLWDSLRAMATPVLVPHRPGGRSLVKKEEEIRQRHHLPRDLEIVFLEVHVGDASDFYQSPLMAIEQQEGRFVIRVTRCASIAHVIATVALELAKVGPPPEVHFGWSEESTLSVNLNFVLFGQGNIPWLTRELINRFEPDPQRRPKLMIG